MTYTTGDLFACPDPSCKFEVLIVRNSGLPSARHLQPVCCCGKTLTPAP